MKKDKVKELEIKPMPMKKRSRHILDSLCVCGHSKAAHENLVGRCSDTKCCAEFKLSLNG